MADHHSRRGAFIFLGFVVVCFVLAAALLVQDRPGGYRRGPKVGIVEISGVITSARPALMALRKFARDDRLKAIVVRVDSPGGTVGPAQEIYREIQRVRRNKPVVASLAAVAASGGYYLASACNRIVANAGTLTGSIGVITQTTNIADLLQTLRVHTETVKSGLYKDTGSPLRAMTDEDRRILQQVVDTLHRQFVEDVAKGRKIAVKKVTAAADGRVLTGRQALALGLVDEIGNFSDALDIALKTAGVSGDPVPVYPPEEGGIWGRILRNSAGAVARSLLGSGAKIEARDVRLGAY